MDAPTSPCTVATGDAHDGGGETAAALLELGLSIAIMQMRPASVGARLAGPRRGEQASPATLGARAASRASRMSNAAVRMGR